MDLTDASWDDVAATLARDDWDRLVVRRPDRPDLQLYSPLGTAVAIHDSQLLPAERAELCRWGFAPMRHAGEGRFWHWDAASTRTRHRGSERLAPGSRVAWALAKQRDQMAVRVVKELLGARPDGVAFVGRSEQEQHPAV